MKKPTNSLAVFLLQWALLISTATSLSVDGVALITFKKNLLSDPYNALGDWNVSSDTPCLWSGVTCATTPQETSPRVVGLAIIGKKLTGTISPALGALTSLLSLKLQGNNLNGSLPAQIFNASSLQILLLGGNRLTGSLPPEISNLINLQTLDLSSNFMLGFIPQSITKCLKLQTLVLANNLFSGPLPDGIGTNFTSLEQLDLSSNLLSGSIPSDLGKLSSLQGTLNLSSNHLSGPIPLDLGNLPYTVNLDLSHNNLSGRIPQDGSLSEQGPGPFLYNPGLCGFPLTILCPVSPYVSPLPSLPTEGSSSSSSSTTTTQTSQGGQYNSSNLPKKPNLGTGAIVAIVVGDAAGISMMAILFVYLYWKARVCKEIGFCSSSVGKDKRHGSSGSRRCFRRASSEESEASGSSEKGKEQGDLVALDKEFSFDIDELLRASAYVLGKSGLGIVYKVVLGNGTPVAVRRLGEGGYQKQKEFESEVQAIGKLRHPNVVRLLAYYWADDEKLLIYEFISNGSLATALHGHSQSPSKALTWADRLRIAKGLARGLAYLHDCSPRKYVHGDIKTTKLLLDGAMHPYIADFGLARLASIAGAEVGAGSGPGTTAAPPSLPLSRHTPAADWSASSSSVRLKNSSTFYRAPEALAHVKPAQKWDVYSFGVVLLELLSGRSPAAHMASAGVDLVAWMRKTAEEGLPTPQILDPAIASAVDLPGVGSLLDLAMACTSPSPDQRPKMKSVADTLDKLAVPQLPAAL